MPLFPFAGAPARGRRRARPDPNQAAIVAALRAAGASVEILADVGRGVPDLLVGVCRAGLCLGAAKRADLPAALTPLGGVLDDRRNFLLEVKSPKAATPKGLSRAGATNRSQVALNETEARWHENWRGQVAVVATVAEALAACFLDARSVEDGAPVKSVEERLAGFHRHMDDALAAAELARGDAVKDQPRSRRRL